MRLQLQLAGGVLSGVRGTLVYSLSSLNVQPPLLTPFLRAYDSSITSSPLPMSSSSEDERSEDVVDSLPRLTWTNLPDLPRLSGPTIFDFGRRFYLHSPTTILKLGVDDGEDAMTAFAHSILRECAPRVDSVVTLSPKPSPRRATFSRGDGPHPQLPAGNTYRRDLALTLALTARHSQSGALRCAPAHARAAIRLLRPPPPPTICLISRLEASRVHVLRLPCRVGHLASPRTARVRCAYGTVADAGTDAARDHWRRRMGPPCARAPRSFRQEHSCRPRHACDYGPYRLGEGQYHAGVL